MIKLARLSSVVRGRRYRKGAIIVTEGDLRETLFFIKNGAAKVTRAGEDGREVILAFLRPDDLFGELSILDGLERSANVIAIDDSEVYFIERRDFLDLIQRHPALSAQLSSGVGASYPSFRPTDRVFGARGCQE